MNKENDMNHCNGVGYVSESEDSSFGNQSDSVFDSNSELEQQEDQDINELLDFLNLRIAHLWLNQ